MNFIVSNAWLIAPKRSCCAEIQPCARGNRKIINLDLNTHTPDCFQMLSLTLYILRQFYPFRSSIVGHTLRYNPIDARVVLYDKQ